MKRTGLLIGLAVLLSLALAWQFLFRPANEEIAALQAETESLELQQRAMEDELAGLREVRVRAPELEAEVAAARAVVPTESALPAVVRQLQSAADAAGIDLVSVAPSRPQAVTVEGGERSLARISVAVNARGRYFQIVDFLRRLEDPAQSPRGLVWNAMTMAADHERYPELDVTFQGEVFALLAQVDLDAAPDPGEMPPPGDEPGEAPVAPPADAPENVTSAHGTEQP